MRATVLLLCVVMLGCASHKPPSYRAVCRSFDKRDFQKSRTWMTITNGDLLIYAYDQDSISCGEKKPWWLLALLAL